MRKVNRLRDDRRRTKVDQNSLYKLLVQLAKKCSRNKEEFSMNMLTKYSQPLNKPN